MDLYSQRVSLKGYMVILALNSNFKIFVSEGTRYRFDAIHPLISSKPKGIFTSSKKQYLINILKYINPSFKLIYFIIV